MREGGGGIAIPWGDLALRVAERAGLGGAGGTLAAAAALIAARGPGAPDALARAAMAARVLAGLAGAEAAAAWALELGALSPARAARDPELGASAGEAASPPARELAALFSAAALLAGEPIAPWIRFGAAAAPALGLLDDLGRLWLDPAIPDLAAPALTPLLDTLLADPDHRGRLLVALAGERDSPSRRFEIHALLASAPFRSSLARAIAASVGAARALVPPARAPGLPLAAAAFLGELEARARFFDELSTFRDLLSAARPREAPPGFAAARSRALEQAGRDAGAALAFLVERAPWPGSWEVQRFGVAGSPELLVGQWFNRAVILEALLDMGEDARDEAARLLLEIPPGGARHYGAWRGVPPDGDMLGLLLRLAAATGAAADRAETWIDVMLASAREDGVVPTWFHQGPAGPTTEGPAIDWAGDDCTGVRLRLLSGLLAHDPRRFGRLIEANARRVLDRAEGGALAGAYYYDEPTTALLFLRFARRCREVGAAPALLGGLAALEAEVRARAARAQRLDGGWQSPQRTAAVLEGAAMESPAPLLLVRAMRYLGEHQLPDGSWPEEPLYLAPAKDDRVGYHRGRELTTALCARALRAAAAALGRAGAAGEAEIA